MVVIAPGHHIDVIRMPAQNGFSTSERTTHCNYVLFLIRSQRTIWGIGKRDDTCVMIIIIRGSFLFLPLCLQSKWRRCRFEALPQGLAQVEDSQAMALTGPPFFRMVGVTAPDILHNHRALCISVRVGQIPPLDPQVILVIQVISSRAITGSTTSA